MGRHTVDPGDLRREGVEVQDQLRRKFGDVDGPGARRERRVDIGDDTADVVERHEIEATCGNQNFTARSCRPPRHQRDACSFISTQEEAVRGFQRQRFRDDGAASCQLLLGLVNELGLTRRARRP